MGHLVNITTEGIMLISEKPIQTGKVYKLKMMLPRKILDYEEIVFEAKSIWCDNDINPAFYDTGFRMINVSPQDVEVIDNLIQNFLFQDWLEILK